MEHQTGNRKLWVILGFVVFIGFAVLIQQGVKLYQTAPPVPDAVVAETGEVLYSAADILDGQNIWQSMGGQEVGSVWGHGAYVAPDWTADWLHRECLYTLENWSRSSFHRPYVSLAPPEQASLRARLVQEFRTNTYDKATGRLTLSEDRVKAAKAMTRYYGAIFSDAMEFDADVKPFADAGKSPRDLRKAYAIANNTLEGKERLRKLGAFFFWASWACAAARPQDVVNEAALTGGLPAAPVSYTNNWPAEELVANRPTGEIIVWSVISFVLLLAGIALLAWYYAVLNKKHGDDPNPPDTDPLLPLKPTPSMRATIKFFWVVVALFLLQIGLGAVTAHYGVEGQGFYGIPLADYLPYSVTRTWHLQCAIFWIATAWLATGLFIAPAVSGYEPPWQRAGVNFLFVCLVIIVAGTLFGTWYATRQEMGLSMNFWFGHQGYEYVDLGRFWQIFLFIGLILWFLLMVRALWPAVKMPNDSRQLLIMFLLSTAAIAMFYGAGLMWQQQTHLAIAEYWRWWVVHLWVEGFFEVFATVVIAFLFTRLQLLRVRIATFAVIFSTIVFLTGGIIGTFHHLYFTGTSVSVLSLGAVFSALEVVPYILIAFEVMQNLSIAKIQGWVQDYRVIIYFFVAVAFWNLVGAGLFGFFINPPIALYYMQGLNTTPVHAHTALFGVYGILGIALMLFCFKAYDPSRKWNTHLLMFGFWALNIGLILEVVLSLLPVGLLQTWASVEHGLWYARSAEFLQTDLMAFLRWMRIIGDTIFAFGALAIGIFVAGLKLGWSYRKNGTTVH